MKKEELKIVITISLSISLLVGILYFYITQSQIELSTLFRAFSSGLTSVTFFWAFYFSYGWKLPLLKKIFYRPNLNGTWGGKIISDYKNKKGETIEPLDFYLVVRQSFLRIHFTTFTSNFVGKSYSEIFALNESKGLKNISYLYRKDTSQTTENFLNEGATELRVIDSPVMKMEGKYWTNVKTTGKINLTFISKKHLDCFEDCENKRK